MIQSLKSTKPEGSIFSVTNSPFGGIVAYKLANDSTGESATIIPSAGAMLNSLVLKKGNQLVEIIDGNANEKELQQDALTTYKSRLLFPFPNRIKSGRYIHEGRMYQFELNNNGNAIHGFCSDSKFEVLHSEVKKTKASLTLGYVLDGKHPAYPFQIGLTIVYEFSKKGLSIWTEVKNLGSKTAPFGLGWHPYFKTGSKIDELEISFPPHKCLIIDDQLIPTGKTTEGFNFTGFEELETMNLDNGYSVDSESKHSKIQIRDNSKNITVEISMQSGYSFFQVFTPEHRQSIAIEPQTCAANAFNNKIGLIELSENEKRIFHFSISLS